MFINHFSSQNLKKKGLKWTFAMEGTLNVWVALRVRARPRQPNLARATDAPAYSWPFQRVEVVLGVLLAAK
jgi:hypothetical protein